MAALVLEDGSVLQGRPFGAAVSTAGEVGKLARADCRPHPNLLNLSTLLHTPLPGSAAPAPFHHSRPKQSSPPGFAALGAVFRRLPLPDLSPASFFSVSDRHGRLPRGPH